MSERFEPTREDRKRRIDELFADEPFLSPTMKAKRLHEKLEGEPAPFDGALKGRSGVALTDGWSDRRDPPLVPALQDQPAETFISLKDARNYLRVETDGRKSAEGVGAVEAHSASLLRTLKDRVLTGWIRDMKAA